MSEYFSYDEIYNIYAWRDNHLKLVSVQGEGTNATVNELTEDDLLKAPHFQLHDERGILAIPDNGNPRVELAVKKQNGTEDLLDCVISDADNGIIICPIRKSLTDVPGYVEGEIRLISANAVIKFTGINFYIYDGVSDNAAMQSSQFSDLILALQQVSAIITGGSSGTISLDTEIKHNGTKPVASGVIYDFVDGNYFRYKSISNDEADTANDSRTIYIHHVNGFRGIIFFAGYNNYNGTTTVKQFRLCKDGKFEYRTGTVKTPVDNPNKYDWDKTYSENWNPIGSTFNIQDAAIIAAKIANNAVITEKIQDSAVTTNKIANSAVVEGKIADGSVTTAKINNAAVTENKIADSAITTNKIATKAVTSAKIDDGAVTTDKIEDSAVTTDKIRNSSVSTAKLANGSVETSKIADSAVTTNKINDSAVSNSKIADNAVSSGKIADNAVITDKIATRAVTPNKLDRTYKESLSISANEIDDAVQENVIYHTIVGGEVASVRCVYNGSALRAQYAETVSGKLKYRTQAKAADEWQAWSDWHLYASTQNIENGAITADKIGTNAVTSIKINNGAVSTDKIANYAVTADKLANNSVTESKIQDSAITTGKINTGAVTTGKIANGAVTAEKLAETYVQTIRTIAGIDLKDNITDSELAHALSYTLVNNEGLLNRAQNIHIGKNNVPVTGGSLQSYYVNDIYVNSLTGDLWICKTAVLNSVWQYTWDYRGSVYNYPLFLTCEIDSDNWDNNEYDLTSELRSAANGRNMVDINLDDTTYNQLVIDGCYGLYVETDTSQSQPTFTLHAMNNAPTVDITIQLILSQVVISQ